MICMRLLLTAEGLAPRARTRELAQNSKKRKTQILLCCGSIEADMRRLLVAMNEVGGCRCNNAVRAATGDGRYVIGNTAVVLRGERGRL